MNPPPPSVVYSHFAILDLAVTLNSSVKLPTPLIEPDLKVKIPTANLEDLLVAKSTYKTTNEPKVEILELFDDFITQQVREEVETISLEETVLLMTSYEDEFFVNLIEPDLERKISTASLEDLLAAKSTTKR